MSLPVTRPDLNFRWGEKCQLKELGETRRVEYSMKCEICGNRAVVHVSEIANGQTTERHFCPDCGTKVLGFPIDTPALLARMDELLKHAEARTHPSWESLAGEHRQKMLNSREECVKGLSGPSPQIRKRVVADVAEAVENRR